MIVKKRVTSVTTINFEFFHRGHHRDSVWMDFKSMHGFCEGRMLSQTLLFFYSVAKLKVFSRFLSRKINIKFMQKNFKI